MKPELLVQEPEVRAMPPSRRASRPEKINTAKAPPKNATKNEARTE